jgi:signal transduction histidine kinase
MVMLDPRIAQYRDAAAAMKMGHFDVQVPVGDDEVGQLGHALIELGRVMERQFSQVQTLSQVTAQINAGLILDEVLSQVYESFRPLIPYDRIGFSLLEEDGQIARSRWVRSDAPHVKIGVNYLGRMAGSSLQHIIETGQPRILNDLEAYLQEHPNSKSTRLILEEGMRSSLTCPLIAMGKPIGFMFFSSMQPNTYTDAHVELFLQIAGQLAVIVEKSRLYQQLVELNQLKSKFLGIAAHDLRSPIGVVKSFVQLFLGGYLGEVPASQRDILQRMDKSCETMLGLINDLLDVTAIEAGQLELKTREMDLTAYLQECHATHAILARAKSIELALDLAPDLPHVVMDPDRINQVLNNLITNAIKYSFPNTVITLRARVTGDEVTIAVQDQGQGIPESELPKMFTDFGKTSVRPTGGEKSIGLGLAIVKEIVGAHGGKISVRSSQVTALSGNQASGTTFTITLPLRTLETGIAAPRHKMQ